MSLPVWHGGAIGGGPALAAAAQAAAPTATQSRVRDSGVTGVTVRVTVAGSDLDRRCGSGHESRVTSSHGNRVPGSVLGRGALSSAAESLRPGPQPASATEAAADAAAPAWAGPGRVPSRSR